MNALVLVLSLGVTPALVAENATLDCGELKAGAPLTKSFRLTNRSANQTVEIAGVTVSCGCTKSAFDKEKILPGESATLTVQINTLAQAAGPWGWAATVRFKLAGSASEETLPLRMTGTLIREVSLTPPGLAFSLASGSLAQDFTLQDTRPVPLAVKTLASTSTFLTATLQPGGKPGEVKVNVVVAENAPVGEHNEVISIITNDPVYPELRVPVRVSKRRPVSVQASPEAVDLSVRTERTLLVQLRRPDGRALTIDKCETASGDLKLAWSSGSTVTATLRVSLAESATQAGSTEVRITLQEPAGESLTLPVRWTKD